MSRWKNIDLPDEFDVHLDLIYTGHQNVSDLHLPFLGYDVG